MYCMILLIFITKYYICFSFALFQSGIASSYHTKRHNVHTFALSTTLKNMILLVEVAIILG